MQRSIPALDHRVYARCVSDEQKNLLNSSLGVRLRLEALFRCERGDQRGEGTRRELGGSGDGNFSPRAAGPGMLAATSNSLQK